MGYSLGIDLGTTFTAAARQEDGRVEILHLGERTHAAPTVMFIGADGSMAFGDAADRLGPLYPERVAREFKRRVGDPTPIVVGDTGYAPESLLATMLDWTYRTIVSSQAAVPERVAVTHPANWGDFKLALLKEATVGVGLGEVITLSEPEAAAISYASQERVDPGTVLAVYDLGGGTFDAAVLRKDQRGFSLLGRPEGIERLGGVDIDAAVFNHVAGATGGALEELDPEDSDSLSAVARLRQECVTAKEVLSADTEVVVPVLLPNLNTEIRLTRSELEMMIRPSLTESVTALRRALRSAEVEPTSLRSVLLVGGSSRIPLVAQMVSTELGLPVAVDAHPKHSIALGAAMAASPDPESFAVTGSGGPPPPRSGRPPPPPSAPQPSAPTQQPPTPPPPPAPRQPPSPEPDMTETPPPEQPLQPAQPVPPPGAGVPPPGAAEPPPPGSGALPPRSTSGSGSKGRRNLIIILVILVIVAVAALVLFLLALSEADDEGAIPLADSQVGECFDRVGGGFVELDIIECSDPHDGQLFAIVTPASAESDAYPGDSELEEEAGPECQAQLVRFYGAPVEEAVATGIDFDPVVPSEASWTQDGIREVRCIAIDAAGGKLTGSIKGSGG